MDSSSYEPLTDREAAIARAVRYLSWGHVETDFARFPFSIFPDGRISRYGSRPVTRAELDALERVCTGLRKDRERQAKLASLIRSIGENVVRGGSFKL